jgi:tRNA(Ile)-lysidine synthase
MPRRPPAVARVLERVTKTAREHEMFRPGDLVLVSCSGGPDSVCLLYSLWHLRRLFKIRLAVFHFDHKLRADSSKDAAYVRTLAERLKLSFHLRVAEDQPLKGESVEAWGWAVRRAARTAVATEIGATKIARGHTENDQAETVVMALIGAGGVFGLGGIRPVDGSEIEPLLDVTRAEVEAFCRASRLRPRLDSTNADTTKRRAAIRHLLMPRIAEVAGTGSTHAIARTASQLRHVTAALRDEVALRAERRLAFEEDGFRFKPGPPLESGPVLRALVIEGFRRMGHRVTESDVASVLDLAQGRRGRRRDLSGGLKAIREKEYVRVSRSSPES